MRWIEVAMVSVVVSFGCGGPAPSTPTADASADVGGFDASLDVGVDAAEPEGECDACLACQEGEVCTAFGCMEPCGSRGDVCLDFVMGGEELIEAHLEEGERVEFAVNVTLSDDGSTAVVGSLIRKDDRVTGGLVHVMDRCGLRQVFSRDGEDGIAPRANVAVSGDGLTVAFNRDRRGDDTLPSSVYVLDRERLGEPFGANPRLAENRDPRRGYLGSDVWLSSDGGLLFAQGYMKRERPSDRSAPADLSIWDLESGWPRQIGHFYAPDIFALTFGHAVAHSSAEEMLVFSEPSEGADAQGALFVYDHSAGWSGEPMQLPSPEQFVDDWAMHGVGASIVVSQDGKTIVAGAPEGGTGGATYEGNVVVWTRGTQRWVVSGVYAPGGRGFGELGAQVELLPDGRIVASAPNYGFFDGGDARGALYVIDPSRGTLEPLVNGPAGEQALLGLQLDLAEDGRFGAVTTRTRGERWNGQLYRLNMSR